MGKKIKSKASSHSSKATSCISRASTSTAIATATAAATVDKSSPPIQKQQQHVHGKEKGSNHNRKGGRSKPITSTKGGAIVEDKELSRALLSSGYRIKYMVGDGNCLFRSIADQLRNDADSHDEIRQTIVSYIESNAEYFKLFMEDDESIEQYISKMKSCYEWGGHQELYAASQCFDTNIVIHQLNSPDYIIQANSLKSNSATTIHLSYHGECHYNSVIMIDHARGGVDDADATASVTTATADKRGRKFNDGVIDLVALSVPWVDREYVMSALSSNEGDVDAAVDWLCTHMSESCGVVTTKDAEINRGDGSTAMTSNDIITTSNSNVHNDMNGIRPDKEDECSDLLVHGVLNDHDEKVRVIDTIPIDSMDKSSAIKSQTLDRDGMGHASSIASTTDSNVKRRGGKIKSRPDARAHKEEITDNSNSIKAVTTTTLSKKEKRNQSKMKEQSGHNNRTDNTIVSDSLLPPNNYTVFSRGMIGDHIML